MQPVMLDIFRKDATRDTLDDYKAKFLDTDAASERLLKKLLMSSSIMAPLVTFVRRKTDYTIADRNAVMAKASRKGSVPDKEANGDIIEGLRSQSDPRSEEPYHCKSSTLSIEKSSCEA